MANKPRSKARAKNKISKDKAALADASSVIAKAAARAEARQDQHLKELITMYKRTSFLCRKLENRCKEQLQTRDLYALSTMYSQQREIIADIRACTDLSEQAHLIISGALKPLGQDITEALQATYYQLRTLITTTSDPKKTEFSLSELNRIIKDAGRASQVALETATTRVQDTLLE